MRFITLVARDLVDLIPPDAEYKFICLKQKIQKDIIESVPYSPKEMLESPWYWNKLSMILNDFISYNDYENIPWCKQFIDIFQDPNYKIDNPDYHINEEHIENDEPHQEIPTRCS